MVDIALANREFCLKNPIFFSDVIKTVGMMWTLGGEE